LHDTVWFEIQGIPAVTIASEEFAEAAAIQATALGMHDARRVFVRHPIQDANDDEMRAKADAVFAEMVSALLVEESPGEQS
jgi:predicted RNA methylase